MSAPLDSRLALYSHIKLDEYIDTGLNPVHQQVQYSPSSWMYSPNKVMKLRRLISLYYWYY